MPCRASDDCCGQRLPILIATRRVDFRCGHQALALMVQTELKLDPHSGITAIFRSKSEDRLKILVWDCTSMVLIYKVLEQGGLPRPRCVAPARCHVRPRASCLPQACQDFQLRRERNRQIHRSSAVMRSPPDCASVNGSRITSTAPQAPMKIGATPPAAVVSSALDAKCDPAGAASPFVVIAMAEAGILAIIRSHPDTEVPLISAPSL